MKIVVIMAGSGERFQKAGYTDSKPLIKVHEKTMIEHVVNMFSGENNFVFICNNEHLRNTNMENVLKSIKPSAQVIGVDSKKLGPVWDTLQALQKNDFLKDDEPVIVTYCDFSVWWDYEDFKRTVVETGCDAAAVSYKGFHPHLLGPQLYASMRVDDNNWMLECREKFSFTENKMDSFQQAGSFYFAKGAFIKKYFSEVVKRNLSVNGEYYVSVVTQVMKEDNLKIYVYPLKHFLQWGTPEDMQTYQFWSDYFASKAG